VSVVAARSLIDLHGGSLQVHQDSHGRVASFEVCLPVAAPHDHVEGAPQPERGSLGRHVLIIDDNQDAAHALAMLVWELGCEARVAYTGCAGVALLQSFIPDVVLLDIGLTDIDGYEACRRIRHVLADRVKIVAVSGFGLDRDKDRAREAGFDGHLTKPADHAALALLLDVPSPADDESVGSASSAEKA
jgi:CheY-like chemotaxis protein